MKTVELVLKGLSPLSQSKFYEVPKLGDGKESPQDYEERTWAERLHVTSTGEVYIPPMALKKAIEKAASFLSIGIKGRGKATYTKHFVAGVLISDLILLGIKKSDVKGEWLFVPSDGKPGGGRRVKKCFPIIPEWSGKTTAYLLDETITKDVFERVAEEAGNFIGVGRFRPERGGFYGRFQITKFNWKNGT